MINKKNKGSDKLKKILLLILLVSILAITGCDMGYFNVGPDQIAVENSNIVVDMDGKITVKNEDNICNADLYICLPNTMSITEVDAIRLNSTEYDIALNATTLTNYCSDQANINDWLLHRINFGKTPCWDSLFYTSNGNVTINVGGTQGSYNVTYTLVDGDIDQIRPPPHNISHERNILVIECVVDGDCDDSVDCTNDTCSANNCVYTPNDGACADSNECTTNEICTLTGCESTPAEGSCDDEDLCTTSDACSAGTCAGTPISCEAEDSCNPTTGNCTKTCSVNGDCDDGLYCNGEETCNSGFCQAGTTVSCSDGDDCTLDICNETEDLCENPTTPNGTSCDHYPPRPGACTSGNCLVTCGSVPVGNPHAYPGGCTGHTQAYCENQYYDAPGGSKTCIWKDVGGCTYVGGIPCEVATCGNGELEGAEQCEIGIYCDAGSYCSVCECIPTGDPGTPEFSKTGLLIGILAIISVIAIFVVKRK